MPQYQTLSKADHVLREIEARASGEFLPIIGPVKGAILAEEVRKAKPKSVLEVGTLIGYSAILIGKELCEDSHLITIEIDADEVEMVLKRTFAEPKSHRMLK
jgi:predicted O-methyltransferase YrrM